MNIVGVYSIVENELLVIVSITTARVLKYMQDISTSGLFFTWDYVWCKY